METRVSSATKEVIIGDEKPTVLIGERINPTGRKKLAAALRTGNLELVRQEALSQVQAGADILDVNVGVADIDEVSLLPQAVQVVMDAVDVPLCIDSTNYQALEAALKVYQGKPLINSVNGEESSLTKVLPLVKKYGAAVVGLTIDDEGIPNSAERRVDVAHKIVARAEAQGIPREDVIIDCLVMTVGAESSAGQVVLETIRRVKAELGVNLTMGASNISFGLPARELINNAFLTAAIAAGVTCPIVNAAKAYLSTVATDLILGRDKFAMRYLKAYRSSL